jgi:hypothetical protein
MAGAAIGLANDDFVALMQMNESSEERVIFG